MNKAVKCQELMDNRGWSCVTQAVSWDRTSRTYLEWPW